ncbi:hypothetical protein AACH06_09660 [Ideonella sp. DXS29W]|uniref:Lipoprotein n=1 Tax=Ideonella lacteola TaxID=2984193 RepID=A0ABU9BPQ6_9BURK
MSKKISLAAVLMASLLAGCGGGGNESGPDEEIQLSSSSIEVEGPPGSCAVGYYGKVHIFGGQPPYTVNNSVPAGVLLSTDRVADSGGSFDVTFLGQCLKGAPVTVEDDMGRLATVELTNSMGQ